MEEKHNAIITLGKTETEQSRRSCRCLREYGGSTASLMNPDLADLSVLRRALETTQTHSAANYTQTTTNAHKTTRESGTKPLMSVCAIRRDGIVMSQRINKA